MAELQALREQLANQNQANAAVRPETPAAKEEPELEAIMKEFHQRTEDEV